MKKSIIAIIMVLATVATLFSGCSGIPDEPPETSLEKYTYINPVGETVIANDEYLEKYGTNVKYIKTINDVEISLNSYYVYSKNAATVDITSLDFDGVSVNAFGYVNINMIAIGKRADNMKIGYAAYDADGNMIYRSYMLLKLKGVKKNEENRHRFYFPTNSARIVFDNYTEPAE